MNAFISMGYSSGDPFLGEWTSALAAVWNGRVGGCMRLFRRPIPPNLWDRGHELNLCAALTSALSHEQLLGPSWPLPASFDPRNQGERRLVVGHEQGMEVSK